MQCVVLEKFIEVGLVVRGAVEEGLINNEGVLVLEFLSLAEATLVSQELVHFFVKKLILLLGKGHEHGKDIVLHFVREDF